MERERSSCQSQRVTSNSADELKVGVIAAAAPAGLWAGSSLTARGTSRVRASPSPIPGREHTRAGLGFPELLLELPLFVLGSKGVLGLCQHRGHGAVFLLAPFVSQCISAGGGEVEMPFPCSRGACAEPADPPAN